MGCIAIRYAKQQADSVKELGKEALRTIKQIAERQSENVQARTQVWLTRFHRHCDFLRSSSRQHEKISSKGDFLSFTGPVHELAQDV
jgi:hypothetical protein